MELHQYLSKLEGRASCFRIRRITDPGDQAFDLANPILKSAVHRNHFPRPNIGEWYVFTTLPPPTYMWTPHGKHGSKLRTARMMSIPLNLSWPFSSKIGVFCTASSYGPGVPKVSRGVAFQGVGG